VHCKDRLTPNLCCHQLSISVPFVNRLETIDILVNLDGEQNKMFGENLCAFCMAAVPREMNFIVEP
jgi:hypothetical protein